MKLFTFLMIGLGIVEVLLFLLRQGKARKGFHRLADSLNWVMVLLIAIIGLVIISFLLKNPNSSVLDTFIKVFFSNDSIYSVISWFLGGLFMLSFSALIKRLLTNKFV